MNLLLGQVQEGEMEQNNRPRRLQNYTLDTKEDFHILLEKYVRGISVKRDSLCDMKLYDTGTGDNLHELECVKRDKRS